MSKINILTKEISELIAAGEVIERPASIVKELLENAIDAKASAITVEIRRGGISYIRVTDNGIGMDKEDASIAFMRHATSKIAKADDLDNIITLGFRGEALASIAAVSKAEITTKTKDNSFGTRVSASNEENVLVEETGCSTGTTVIIRDLFYNVPARLKFLKRDISEGSSINGIMDKIALSHPEISFKLISDNKIKLHTPGDGELISAIHSIFGNDFAASLIKVSYELNGISVNGYTSKLQASRTNRAMQHFFVNSRYVKSKTCLVALEEGYKNSVMTGRYPFCVLDILMAPSSVDVNVHPAKIEVRFVQERVIFDTIYFAVKSALSKNDELKPSQGISSVMKNPLSTFKSEELDQTKIIKNEQITHKNDEPSYSYKDELSPLKQASSLFSNETKYNEALKNPQDEKTEFSYIKQNNLEKSEPEPLIDMQTGEILSKPKAVLNMQEPKTEIAYFKIIGELFKTYLLFEGEDSFFLLDKHAAHERIIFEQLKKSVLTTDRQILLKPIVTPVSKEEQDVLLSNTDTLDKLGFLYDEFGTNSIIIREIPLVLSEYNIVDIFLDIANKLLENKRVMTSDIYEKLLHSMACRAAIKARDKNTNEELLELLRQVYENDDIRSCPHGRPVFITLTRSEIEKRFGRI